MWLALPSWWRSWIRSYNRPGAVVYAPPDTKNDRPSHCYRKGLRNRGYIRGCIQAWKGRFARCTWFSAPILLFWLQMDIPMAPGLGLLLDQVDYTYYNKRFCADGSHQSIDWERYKVGEGSSFRFDLGLAANWRIQGGIHISPYSGTRSREKLVSFSNTNWFILTYSRMNPLY